jgi:hypothetical protein
MPSTRLRVAAVLAAGAAVTSLIAAVGPGGSAGAQASSLTTVPPSSYPSLATGATGTHVSRAQ